MADSSDKTVSSHDLESNHESGSHLINDIVESYAWQNINVTVPDRATGQIISILENATGLVRAGELIAIMGPSGSGKTTLLNTISHRRAAAKATESGSRYTNGQILGLRKLQELSSYVEQDDALLGSLTVRETMRFAAGLSLPSRVTKKELMTRVDDLISSFGLQSQSDTIVGTPIKKGLSGGQKKRLGIASRLVTDPKILFLDEPTSGLDSTLSFEVMNYIRHIARKNNLVVIASIHQPSTSTFQLFDKLYLLSSGRTCYFGPVTKARDYFDRIGYTMPNETNPAEFYLDLINTDLALAKADDDATVRAAHIAKCWSESPESQAVQASVSALVEKNTDATSLSRISVQKPGSIKVLTMLLQRSWIKSYRDIVAYGIRFAMYLGLALMMGTVFLRFNTSQEYIQPFVNAIFFSSAFLSFMAVAYVPSYLEDQATFFKERANGIVSPFPFILANFLIGLPFLFAIVVLFAIVQYWLTGFYADGQAFLSFIMWLFLDLLAAESLVVLVSSIVPVFVVSLAVVAFSNGLWMSCNGFLVPMSILNVFWRYVFHYIDYQAYVFQGMMVNEFKHRTYECAKAASGGYNCMYTSDLASEGKIRGTAVLEYLGINPNTQGMFVGILIAIIFVYRLLGYIALKVRSS